MKKKDDTANAWEVSRPAYQQYCDTKRNLNRCTDKEKRMYRRLERAEARYIDAQRNAYRRLDDPTQNRKLSKALVNLQKAKANHRQARAELSAAFEVFKNAELVYSVVIFKNLMKDHNLTVADLSRAFGVWNSRIAEWMHTHSIKKLGEIYNEEFLMFDSEDEDEDEDDAEDEDAEG